MTDTHATQPARRRPRRRGRPSLLTPTVMDLLTRATAVGLPMTQAADAAGIGRSTFLRWMSEGEDVVETKQQGQLDVNSPDIRAALYARVTRARAAAAVRATGHIEEAARGAVVSETYRTWTDPVTGEHRSERRVRRRPGDWHASAWLLDRLDPNPKSLHELLDEEDARQRARETPMERALTPHLQDLAERLQKTLAQYQEEDGTPPRPGS
ncbi:hypothetical protein [Streptomyces rubrogriseus]|uniref:Helix-turn-helix domain-containing protein n=1 Tax=Streptomyces rubrogriseus TaxID=194673 RepID=A0A6G3T680_9ACTN|nr:hypothetical protein [Streptomyces rubrogriseus]NEC32210.1 hypothetical protein [Streptomyces rubrogriseus]NEC40142.1 hypothetical protein [Streptomyces rubrogriseus]